MKNASTNLGTLANVYDIDSCDWKQGPGHRRHIYCESPGLSLPAQGIRYKALLVDADSVPNLTPELLQHWIDFCSMFLDLENYEPQGQAERRARYFMAERRVATIARHVTLAAQS